MNLLSRLTTCGLAWLINLLVSSFVFFIGHLEDKRSIYIQEHREVLSPVGTLFIKGYPLICLVPIGLLVMGAYAVRKHELGPSLLFSTAALGAGLVQIGYVALYFLITYQRFFA